MLIFNYIHYLIALMQYIIMGYLKKNVNENSIKALKPNNRLQGDVPKKRLNITIDQEVYYQLKATGNVSGTIEHLAKDYLNNLNSHEDRKETNAVNFIEVLRELLTKIESKEKGYRSNGSGQLISDLKQLLSDFGNP